MNLKEIKEIVKLMNDNELSEVQVEREGSTLKLKKGGDVVAAPVIHAAPAAAPPSSY